MQDLDLVFQSKRKQSCCFRFLLSRLMKRSNAEKSTAREDDGIERFVELNDDAYFGLRQSPSSFGTIVRVEFGDSTTAADPSDAHTISQSFSHTYGQPLAHFLRATAKVSEAQIVANLTERQIASVVTDCNLNLNKVRGAVNNTYRILQGRRAKQVGLVPRRARHHRSELDKRHKKKIVADFFPFFNL